MVICYLGRDETDPTSKLLSDQYYRIDTEHPASSGLLRKRRQFARKYSFNKEYIQTSLHLASQRPRRMEYQAHMFTKQLFWMWASLRAIRPQHYHKYQNFIFSNLLRGHSGCYWMTAAQNIPNSSLWMPSLPITQRHLTCMVRARNLGENGSEQTYLPNPDAAFDRANPQFESTYDIWRELKTTRKRYFKAVPTPLVLFSSSLF